MPTTTRPSTGGLLLQRIHKESTRAELAQIVTCRARNVTRYVGSSSPLACSATSVGFALLDQTDVFNRSAIARAMVREIP